MNGVFTLSCTSIAWIRVAVINVLLTKMTLEASTGTITFVGIDLINAQASIVTRIVKTLVDISFTSFTFKARQTLALKVSDSIQTSCIVVAWIWVTFVDLCFTIDTNKAGQTFALIAAIFVDARAVV